MTLALTSQTPESFSSRSEQASDRVVYAAAGDSERWAVLLNLDAERRVDMPSSPSLSALCPEVTLSLETLEDRAWSTGFAREVLVEYKLDPATLGEFERGAKHDLGAAGELRLDGRLRLGVAGSCTFDSSPTW